MQLIPKYIEAIKEVREMISDECADISDGLIQRTLIDNTYADYGNDSIDFYGAAADSLLLLAAKYKTQFNFSSGDQRYDLKQKHDNCLALYSTFQTKARLKSFFVTRNDTWY